MIRIESYSKSTESNYTQFVHRCIDEVTLDATHVCGPVERFELLPSGRHKPIDVKRIAEIASLKDPWTRKAVFHLAPYNDLSEPNISLQFQNDGHVCHAEVSYTGPEFTESAMDELCQLLESQDWVSYADIGEQVK
ncbi:hypothetical protein NG895_07560 [Aeoliella sp. ICT_H6.2]|uniref:Uncharacterized protein n=1 Tax=Aeoliella straminimaris TaxID=2954799 RepID=A0A9X2FDC1_9BACT|nr:hypothetical protein [Aeoliella straminimaris]MCO6043761.1 hypothetical protein [Aeoliella straminimaris]